MLTIQSAVVNNPKFIELQYLTLKKFVDGDYKFQIYNHAKEYADVSNYHNVNNNGEVVPDLETNTILWTPLQFFTNSAGKMFEQLNLRDAYNQPVTVNNIPIYPFNNYTPAVHRILQLAANVFESTTNSLYPCIYRPTFTTQFGTNIIISGYELVNGPDAQPTSLTFLTTPIDLAEPNARAFIKTTSTSLNVYGVPWIIGARKGFPNLNVVAMQSVARITRNLLISRPDTTTTDYNQYRTSQLLVVGVSNSVGVEVWNSYRTNYPYSVPAPLPARQVYVQADGRLLMALTNSFNKYVLDIECVIIFIFYTK